jgi:dTDP-4-amino-4,6-dideoxygalactose transaminase
VSEEACASVLSLPIHGRLSDQDVELVVDAVRGFFEGAGA